MKKLKIAYFGTPYFSADFLEKILTDTSIKKVIEVKFVVTQPDKKVGRKQILTPSPVKLLAQKYKLEIGNWDLIRNSKLEIRNLDFCLLYAFGQIIPSQILNQPKYGVWCIHPSLLPKYRGPSPMAYPLIMGETTTGVTIFQMDEKIDHGPIIAQEKLSIFSTDRRPDLEIKLTNLAVDMFKNLLGAGAPHASKNFGIKQPNKLATYTKLLTKQDGFIPLPVLEKALKNEPLSKDELPKILQKIRNSKLEIRNSAKIIYDYFRGLYPWPGLWTLLSDGKRLKLTDLQLHDFKTLKLVSVQLEGKKEANFETFNRAYHLV